jgi:hypothetical protein
VAAWRVALVDSAGALPGAAAAASFAGSGDGVARGPGGPDPTGHGTRIAALIAAAAPTTQLLLAQVFPRPGPTTPAAVAAAIDWAVALGAGIVHLSLGLGADRRVLAAAVADALAAGCLVVASVPARAGTVYPAAYPGVLRGTGDARCAPGELSRLGPATFGACPAFAAGTSLDGRGASIGAARVTVALLELPPGTGRDAALAALGARSRYHGAERRSALPPAEE